MCNLLLSLRMCHLLLLLSPSFIDSSLEQLVRHSHHLHRPPECYSPSGFTATVLSEPASCSDATLYTKCEGLEKATRRGGVE
jgi:hypothetical protein